MKAAAKNGRTFLTVVGDNGPDMNPSGYINLLHWGRLWRNSNLTRLTCVTYPAGRSAFNPIEHAWSPLSNALTGVTLPVCLPGEDKPPNKQNLAPDELKVKEALMLDEAANILATYWNHLRYDGNAVIPVVIPSNNTNSTFKDHKEIENFVNAPLRQFKTDEDLRKIREEFRDLCNHTDRRFNEISFMKCQLYREAGDECTRCLGQSTKSL